MSNLEGALSKLRASTELALGFPDARLTRAESSAVLSRLSVVEAKLNQLEKARDKWYATEKRLRDTLESRNRALRNLILGEDLPRLFDFGHSNPTSEQTLPSCFEKAR